MATTDRDSGDDLTPPPMLTVAAVARRLGVAPSTLRTWDRRYDLGPSAHTAGSHRRYGPDDLARLVVMRRLTLDGVPPAEAARIALATAPEPAWPAQATLSDAAGHGPAASAVAAIVGAADSSAVEAAEPAHPHPDADDPAAGRPAVAPVDGVARRLPTSGPAGAEAPSAHDESWVAPAIPAARSRRAHELEHALWNQDSTRREGLAASWPLVDGHAVDSRAARAAVRSGGGRVVALPDGTPAARGLARAAMSLDSGEVHRLFGDAVRTYGVRVAWETMAMPVLQSIGERWRLTGDGVDVEHAFSEAVVAVLHGVTAGLRRPRNVRPVVLTCAEGDYHTLPLHALAAALAEQEVGVRLLGVGMPAAALVAAVRRTGPSTVFVYAQLPIVDVQVLELLPRQRPAPRLVVGGPGWAHSELPAQVAVARALGDAVDHVLAVVDV
jgi:hypothetical protein